MLSTTPSPNPRLVRNICLITSELLRARQEAFDRAFVDPTLGDRVKLSKSLDIVPGIGDLTIAPIDEFHGQSLTIDSAVRA